MADTVKTQVMKALETVLRAGVPEVKTVERREPVGTDLDKVGFPALYLYDDDESGARHNRLRWGVIRVEMAVFIRLKPGKDTWLPGFLRPGGNHRRAGLHGDPVEPGPDGPGDPGRGRPQAQGHR